MEDFNRMAAELQRQSGELERRHRLAAWAEMASQVAHEIKNPLTPIQLHAEHLRRVHDDRGRPLGDVVSDSTTTILEQVTLLRRIASDFSSFAASPVAHPGRVNAGALIEEVLAPYGRGLTRRVRFERAVPPGAPDMVADRTLVARALTNLVENALHAIPGEGTLTVRVREEPGLVAIDVADTGVGMEAEALARAFEPSFSTKLTGTGLGLPIARRNVELSRGTIAIDSAPGRGTTVTVRLPRAD
jgi:two-component system nitrogen regulation sensor histidine kinase NtrY